MADRTFGWIQDPGEISKLRRVIEIFDRNTETHQDLIAKRIPTLVRDITVRNRLLTALSTDPLRISYSDLRGQRGTCNGVVQVLLPGQNHDCLSEWAAENFVRWAHALGFLHYQAADDIFVLSDMGRNYINQPVNKDGINSILEDALLSYPPVIRILRLLSQEVHLTKFEMGSRLGFVGEKGFTTLPQNLLVRELALEVDSGKRAKMLSDWDGTSDKYARMISGWLQIVGWVKRETKIVRANVAGHDYSHPIPQAYTITDAGLGALRRADGRSRHPRSIKNVYFEMLATKAPSRNYLRLRRALILQALQGKSFFTIVQLQATLSKSQFFAGEATIVDDLKGFENIGLQIERNAQGAYRLCDTIRGLIVPAFAQAETLPGDIQQLKEKIRPLLQHVSHDRLVLVDLSFDSTQNRLFETQTIALLLTCGYKGAHLGGADKPDGAVYTSGTTRDYGLIVDTKAYSNGFACAAHERREMQNYIQENIHRPKPHPTSWWSIFPESLHPPDDFRFLFVSSRFVGDYVIQFQRLSKITSNTLGVGITAANLLLYAEALQAGKLTLEDGYRLFEKLSEITIAVAQDTQE